MKRILTLLLTLAYFIPGISNELPDRQKSVTINVMTYNVHHCNPPAVKGKIDVDAIAEVIKSNNVDIAFIQETDVRTDRVGGIDQAQELSQKSGLKFFRFFKAIDLAGGEYGVTIISVFPLDSAACYPLYKEGESEQRVLGTAVVTLKDKRKLLLACTHLDLSSRLREVEVAQIDSILSKVDKPVILCGDFNATPSSKEIKFMEQRYSSSAKEYIFTFPNKDPETTIDYIFFSKTPMLRAISHRVLQGINASDHLPVLSVLEYLR